MATVPKTGARERDPASLVIGVLGGIASGKSAVARLLAGPQGLCLSADAIAQEVLDSPAVLERVRARFGDEAIGADGKADRVHLARRVFAPGGAALRSELESWTHPAVRDRILELSSAARTAGVPRIVLDVPLLLENDAQHGLARLCDVLVFVEANEAERDRRARSERGWSSGEVARREALQLPLTHKKQRAHHVIVNDRGLAELERAVAGLLESLARERERT
jgi:dephospho-CoA kinase